MGAERYNLFTGCPLAKTATIVLRGGSDQFIDEADRSLHDAIMIVRRALKHAEVVPGGGAIEMEVGHLVATACIGGGAGKVGGWAWRGRGGGGHVRVVIATRPQFSSGSSSSSVSDCA